MKIVIRQGMFETNSSSTHTLTIIEDDQMEKWKNGEIVYNKYEEKFVNNTDEEYQQFKKLIDFLNNSDSEDDAKLESAEMDFDGIFYDDPNYFVEYEDFIKDDWDNKNETYYETYKTKSGNTIHIFGTYGYQ